MIVTIQSLRMGTHHAMGGKQKWMQIRGARKERVRGADQLSMKCLLSSHTLGAEIRTCGQFKLLIPPVTPLRDASARSSVVKPCRRRSLYSPAVGADIYIHTCEEN